MEFTDESVEVILSLGCGVACYYPPDNVDIFYPWDTLNATQRNEIEQVWQEFQECVQHYAQILKGFQRLE